MKIQQKSQKLELPGQEIDSLVLSLKVNHSNFPNLELC